ncbi:response regulator transcription factor [uncultured Tenacibaculum sp.]|uniref:response regulator transcription factor n=1 Tax=uncultured Tenacibaculum sp. TaxID=174713 RepID=UPI002632B350|nr:response regulator transcription factor [uncultured Tenacibaculum sp.]
MKNILIIEDDIAVSKLLEFNLKAENFYTKTSTDGKVGLDLALKEDFSLIILDLTLPGLNGIEVCKSIRKVKNTPILMLTAKSNEIDKVLGLEIGADDYMTKPFSVRELLARVNALIRRNLIVKRKESENKLYKNISFDELSIDIEMRKVTLNTQRINLSPKEFELLVLMASTPGKVYSRDSLLKIIWGYDFEGYRHTVNSHINRLRNKIESNSEEPKFILTSWGVGYRFNEELKIPSRDLKQNYFKQVN